MELAGFTALLERLAAAWAEPAPRAAAKCFTEDAIYMEPPDRQLFVGRNELRAYFSPLESGTYLTFHTIVFDAERQVGMVEFSFGVAGNESASHGVAVVGVRGGQISSWREYWRGGPADWSAFVATDDKTWEWHAGNYP